MDESAQDLGLKELIVKTPPLESRFVGHPRWVPQQLGANLPTNTSHVTGCCELQNGAQNNGSPKRQDFSRDVTTEFRSQLPGLDWRLRRRKKRTSYSPDGDST